MTEFDDRLRLPPVPSSAGAARRFVAAALGSSDEVAELAVLLVSELASNAVLHARTAFELAVHVTADCIRVEIKDGNHTMPALKSYVTESITGRGLHMVAASAHRWGFESEPDGKVVWFELLLSSAEASR
ncbi:MAG TPA: ATP-binding protein [Acidimicrobiales bacterium]|jgi:anti-sigma regulatory factor (Ser/Thr protein kinase)|nr:ATP-binding protein [Acidimicrobiales bacterium]